ncbi:MAG: hypothetical protein KGJ57_07125 [Sphingomonadales bacterium]|nr:hypothetical protein [Sphingomonadales bacterium]MDE2169184.1 hypothetical protein [Sphingomonadales bacterium]
MEHDETGALHKQGALMIGVMALALLLVHFAAGHVRDSAWRGTVAASDTRVAIIAQQLRQSVLFAHANMPGLDRDVRAAELAEGAGMGQGKSLSDLRANLTNLSEGAAYQWQSADLLEMSEAALQLAILLVAVAIAASLRWAMRGGVAVAGLGLVFAVVVAVQITLF